MVVSQFLLASLYSNRSDMEIWGVLRRLFSGWCNLRGEESTSEDGRGEDRTPDRRGEDETGGGRTAVQQPCLLTLVSPCALKY